MLRRRPTLVPDFVVIKKLPLLATHAFAFERVLLAQSQPAFLVPPLGYPRREFWQSLEYVLVMLVLVQESLLCIGIIPPHFPVFAELVQK